MSEKLLLYLLILIGHVYRAKAHLDNENVSKARVYLDMASELSDQTTALLVGKEKATNDPPK